MKKVQKIVLMIALCISQLFIQCSSDDSKIVEEKTLTDKESNEIKVLTDFLVETLMIDSKKIIYDVKTSSFIIDGDVIMPLEEAREHYNSRKNTKSANKITQRYNGLSVSKENSEIIKVYTSPEVPMQ